MELKVEIICVKCNGKNLVKNGKSHSGEQRYLCKDCKRTQQKDYQRNGDKPEIKSLIKEMVHNGCGVRQTGRILKISKDTVTKYLKNYLKANVVLPNKNEGPIVENKRDF